MTLGFLLSFQNAVSKHGAQFQGHAQHDALEFLLWLLDRVHEDSESSSRGPGSQQVSPLKQHVVLDFLLLNIYAAPAG